MTRSSTTVAPRRTPIGRWASGNCGLFDSVAREVEVRSFAGGNVMYKSGEVLRSELIHGIRIAVADLFS